MIDTEHNTRSRSAAGDTQMPQVQQVTYANEQLTALYKLLREFSVLTAVRMEKNVNIRANENRWPVRMNGDGSVKLAGNLKIENYQVLLKDACGFADNLLGKRMVNKNLQAVYDRWSKEKAGGLYECVYRLGLTDRLKT